MKLATFLRWRRACSWVAAGPAIAGRFEGLLNGWGLVFAGKVFRFAHSRLRAVRCFPVSTALIASRDDAQDHARKAMHDELVSGEVPGNRLRPSWRSTGLHARPGVYWSLKHQGKNPAADAGGDGSVRWPNCGGAGFRGLARPNAPLADDVQEKHAVWAQPPGASTLAVGHGADFFEVTRGWGWGFLYHFAIMFEALFILTSLNAGTRVERYCCRPARQRLETRWGERSLGAERGGEHSEWSGVGIFFS